MVMIPKNDHENLWGLFLFLITAQLVGIYLTFTPVVSQCWTQYQDQAFMEVPRSTQYIGVKFLTSTQ